MQVIWGQTGLVLTALANLIARSIFSRRRMHLIKRWHMQAFLQKQLFSDESVLLREIENFVIKIL